jgi:Bacterial toxin 44
MPCGLPMPGLAQALGLPSLSCPGWMGPQCGGINPAMDAGPANNGQPCTNVPQSPLGASATFNANVVKQETQGMWPATKLDYFDQVFQTRGTFDYKTGGDQYVDYGNWNFGYVCAANYGPLFCQSAAGMNHMYRSAMQGHNPFGSGIPFITPPYGDQAADNQQIQNGIKAYQSGCVQ